MNQTINEEHQHPLSTIKARPEGNPQRIKRDLDDALIATACGAYHRRGLTPEPVAELCSVHPVNSTCYLIDLVAASQEPLASYGYDFSTSRLRKVRTPKPKTRRQRDGTVVPVERKVLEGLPVVAGLTQHKVAAKILSEYGTDDRPALPALAARSGWRRALAHIGLLSN